MSNSVSLKFSHFGIFVVNLAVMKNFYTDVLGYYITDEGLFPDGQSLVFLSRDPDEHHQIILVDGRPDASGFNPINQISFFVKDLEELQSFYLVVKAAEVNDLQPITHGNAWSVYFRDPEGNRIEVYTHTPWYVSQPLREAIDLERSILQIQVETETLCRSLPGFQSRTAWQASMKTLMNK
ncbi:MAG: catechol 2,3-dioxygenase [Gammaproteobacteria bacterium]|jgi:catechol 2,3-dioxygenase